MKLKDILVATVVGGVFHVEDAVFQTNIELYVEKLGAVINKARKAKRIKHDYFVRLLNKDKDDDTITGKTMLSLQCVDEKKVQIQISEKAVVFEIGALLKQNSLFRKDGYLHEVACLIEDVVKFRKPKKVTDFGIYPKFVIPFSSEVAPDHMCNLLFKTFDKDIGLPKVDQLAGFNFIAATRHNNLTVESQFRTTNDRDGIIASFDIRAVDAALARSYGSFLLKAKPLYEGVCKGIMQKLLELDGIKEKLLITNKE
ncbi:MAG: hypothetical protein KAT56_10015 [Sedimentisphaerales bacterium]|nr:hypothetical protein [Sedimentisphaerales bacterium]